MLIICWLPKNVLFILILRFLYETTYYFLRRCGLKERKCSFSFKEYFKHKGAHFHQLSQGQTETHSNAVLFYQA